MQHFAYQPGSGPGFRPRLAASLLALMSFLWLVLLHIPRALAGPNHANEAAGVFEALALTGVALLVAGTGGGARSAGSSARPMC